MRRTLDRFRPFFAYYGISTTLFSFLFGLIVISTFYGIQWIVPRTMEMYTQTVTVLFILFSLLILFPARERILKRFLNKNRYDEIFGSNLHHIDFIARQFTQDTMIFEVFPDLMSWLHVPAGRIVIMNSDRKDYTIHTYRNGKLVGRPVTMFQQFDEIHHFLRNRKKTINFFEEVLPPEMKRFMEKNRATTLHPFLYRKNPVGFLMLQDPPRHKYADRALELFTRKAAVSIHNHMLSGKIVDSHLYEREFREAGKIRDFLSRSGEPRIPGYQIKTIQPSGMLQYFEFLTKKKGRNNESASPIFYPVILSSPGLTSASGIVLAGVIGKLYTLHNYQKEQLSLHTILQMLRQESQITPAEYRLDFSIGELNAATGMWTTTFDGNYRIFSRSSPETNLLTIGWRNQIAIAPGESYHIEYCGSRIFEIHRLAGTRKNAGETSIRKGKV